MGDPLLTSIVASQRNISYFVAFAKYNRSPCSEREGTKACPWSCLLAISAEQASLLKSRPEFCISDDSNSEGDTPSLIRFIQWLQVGDINYLQHSIQHWFHKGLRYYKTRERLASSMSKSPSTSSRGWKTSRRKL